MPFTFDTQFQRLCLDATNCRRCFKDKELRLEAPTIDIAQPRWIGRTYWKARPRVLVLMLNPGSGDGRKGKADRETRKLIRAFSKDKETLDAVTERIKKDAQGWGRGRFKEFYSEDLGLEFEDIAFANVAWCATRGNKYPPKMLDQCFSRHTEGLLFLLDPQVVLLSGNGVHRFHGRVQEALPKAAIIEMLHFAHRKGAAVWSEKSKAIRAALTRASR